MAGSGGQFTVDVALAATSRQGNAALAGYKPAFIDPSSAAFHPGQNAAAPGLVVLMSTTPKIANTPLQGPNTNLAGVFEINDISKVRGLARTFHSWIVTSPGFFGKGVQATLTVYAVNGPIRAFPRRGELARRMSGDLTITLYWTEPDRRTGIEVTRRATGETMTFDVPRRRAYEAFYHPFAYLAEVAGTRWRDAA